MDCREIIEKYVQWIKDNTVVHNIESGKSCAVSTPFLDRHNDNIEIYILKEGAGYKLTDDGFTLNDLEMSGMDVASSPKREKIFRTILNGFGIKVGADHEIFVIANSSNIGQKKHYLIQAILAVNDMFALSQESIYSLFKEDVEIYFSSNNLRFSKDIKLTGKTGFDHNIDFLISASQHKPERLIKTINSPKKDYIIPTIFAFNDIRDLRETPTQNYVIFNDQERQPSSDVIAALDSYQINHIGWSQKELCLDAFGG